MFDQILSERDDARAQVLKVEADKARLRKALTGLVGAKTKEELEQMEAFLRLAPAPDADKATAINAIHALLETATTRPQA